MFLLWRHFVVGQRMHFARTNCVQLIAAQGIAHAREVVARNGDLQIVVLACLPAQKQIDGPATDHTPVRAAAGQLHGGLLW